MGGLDGLGHDLARAFGERGEDAAGVEPADALFVEEFLPIDVARLHAGGGGVAAVIERDAGPLGVADFGEVQADAVALPTPSYFLVTAWEMSMPTARAWLAMIRPIGEVLRPPTQPVRRPSRDRA